MIIYGSMTAASLEFKVSGISTFEMMRAYGTLSRWRSKGAIGFDGVYRVK